MCGYTIFKKPFWGKRGLIKLHTIDAEKAELALVKFNVAVNSEVPTHLTKVRYSFVKRRAYGYQVEDGYIIAVPDDCKKSIET